MLESIHLTEEDYADLKNSVMKNVIEGKDVFKKTTPEVSILPFCPQAKQNMCYVLYEAWTMQEFSATVLFNSSYVDH